MVYAIGPHKYDVPINLIERAHSLRKREFEYVEDNGYKFLLVGSPMAIEDSVEESVFKLFETVSATYIGELSETDCYDEVAEIRDSILYHWCNINNITIVYGTTEF